MVLNRYPISLLSILWIVLLSIPKTGICQRADTSFSFKLDQEAKTSAGIYSSDGVLLRTLWSGINYKSGIHRIIWDGTDDAGKTLPKGDYVAKVLSNNIRYEWEVLANSSAEATGPSVHRGLDYMNGIVINGIHGYYSQSYGENDQITFKFLLNDPQRAIAAGPMMGQEIMDYVATDGTLLYWAGKDPYNPSNTYVRTTRCTDDEAIALSSGSSFSLTHGKTFSVINLVNNSAGLITGLAVQKNGKYLFVTRKSLNKVYVLDKTTGELIRTVDFVNPSRICIDGNDNLWMITEGTKVRKYIVEGNGQLAGATTLPGLTKPLSVSVSPEGLVYVTDGGNKQQIRIFDSKGFEQVAFGRPGGLISNASVENNSFCFNDARNDYVANLSFQSDGSFWVIDPGNRRTMHFSADKEHLETIQYNTPGYCVAVDLNDPTRVFINYLEFKVDYSKPLLPNNGSWSFVKNWGVNLTNYQDDQLKRLKCINTLSNGRTYGMIVMPGYKNSVQLVELVEGGTMRFTTSVFSQNYQLQPDGSVRRKAEEGSKQVWYKKDLVAFDSNGNPMFGNEAVYASTSDAPFHGGARLRVNSVTSSGILVAFDGTDKNDYHLGGIQLSDNKVLFKTSSPTHGAYEGDMPGNGDYDIGNGAAYRGSTAMANGKNIIWGYAGEFWKDNQTNIWNHYYDNGLFIGQFGACRPDLNNAKAPYGFDGNAFNSDMVKVEDTLYVYHGGESSHSGINRWKITGLNSVHEQVIPLTDLFYSSKGTIQLPGIDLMEGLPSHEILSDNTNGWTRFPALDNEPLWHAKTSKKTYGFRKNPDLWIRYNAQSGPHYIARDLGRNTGLDYWKISGNISFEENSPNLDGTMMYLDILDANDKILTRFYTLWVAGTPDLAVSANSTTIARSHDTVMNAVFRKFQPLEILMQNDQVTVRYAQYEPVTINSFDSLGELGSPKTMRLSFEYPGHGNAYTKVIDLDQFRFSFSKKQSYFKSQDSGDWDDVSIWQTSTDNLNWTNAALPPDSNAAGITIQQDHSVTIFERVAVANVSINAGAALTISSQAELVVNDGPGEDLSVLPGGRMIIASTSDGTGRISASAGTIKGEVTVEHYFGLTNNTAYRLLAPSVNTINSSKPYILDNWQEGQNNTTVVKNANRNPKFGTHITGPNSGDNGFDASQDGQASLFTFNQASRLQGWSAIANTNATSLEAKKGYLLMIKGDRGINLNDAGSNASNTTLRATGSILSGTQAFENLEGGGRTSLIGNPYASSINWSSMYNDPSADNASKFESYYTYWDPNISSTGGYVSVNINGIKSAPTNASTEIPSGTAFFIKAKRGVLSPTFTIKEAHKSAVSSRVAFRTAGPQKLSALLYFTGEDGSNKIADGVTVVFDESYSAEVDSDDAEEIPNWNENIAIERDGNMLSIESRPLVSSYDTIPIAVSGLRKRQYEWQIHTEGLVSEDLLITLKDKFLGTTEPIQAEGITIKKFDVTEDPLSSSTDRFSIVLAPHATLPVHINNIQASYKSPGVQVDWIADSEVDIEKYEVEKSVNGTDFKTVATVKAKGNNIASLNYTWFDADARTGANFYRLKALSNNGKEQQSAIAKVLINDQSSGLSLFPNPVRGNSVRMSLNASKGKYKILVRNGAGQLVMEDKIEHNGMPSTETLQLNRLVPGNYQVEVTNGKSRFTQQIIKY